MLSDTEMVMNRIGQLSQPDANSDPAVLDAILNLDGVSSIAEAGRALANVPSHLLCQHGEPKQQLRIALAGTFVTSNLVPLLRVALLRAGIVPVFHETGYGQILNALVDPESELAEFQPDVTLCLMHAESFMPSMQRHDMKTMTECMRIRIDSIEECLHSFTERTQGIVLLHTVPVPRVEHDSIISYNDKSQFGRIWRDLNIALLRFAERYRHVYVLDLEILLTDSPAGQRDNRLFHFASMAWTLQVELSYALEVSKFCSAVTGLSRKCLVLDLDGCLWGGTLGDDGPSGIRIGGEYPGNCYTEVQLRAAELGSQGVLLALSSKNDPALVDEVITAHPDMLLRDSDLVAREVGWHPKDAGIRRIASVLNIRLENIVFADDSIFECNHVRRSMPEVTVIELTGDPSDYAAALTADGYFNTTNMTATDYVRGKLYKADIRRKELAKSADSIDAFLSSIDLRVRVTEADEYALPRLVQLSRRTRQFTMIRQPHTEAHTVGMAESRRYLLLAFEVSDCFADEGIVGGVWIERRERCWHIENFIMSCRVFARGIEYAVLQDVINRAVTAGVTSLSAVFEATDRNTPAAGFYESAGFTKHGEGAADVQYELSLRARRTVTPRWIRLTGDCDD